MVILYRNPESGFFNITESGYILTTHKPSDCLGRVCDVHDRVDDSDPLKDTPLNLRVDRHIMERICEHGIGHTTRAQRDYWKSLGWDDKKVSAYTTHGCDGCCLVHAIDNDSDDSDSGYDSGSNSGPQHCGV